MRPTLLLLLAACSFTPTEVTQDQVEGYATRGDIASACVGLKMPADDLRRFTAERLQRVEDPAAADCICAALPKAGDGWDTAVATGLIGTENAAVIECFSALIEQPELPRRAEAIAILGRVRGDAGKAALGRIASGAGDAASRAAAVTALRGDKTQIEPMVKLLSSDGDPAVRAAAAFALGEISTRDEAVMTALRTAASADADGKVRGAAIAGLRRNMGPEEEKVVCLSLLNDADEAARLEAARFFRGSTSAEAAACLRERLFKKEDSGPVREALLESARYSKHPDAARALCDAIPFYLKTYLGDALPEKVQGSDIIKAQNERDWQNSYACVEKAKKASGGTSCYARLYVATWFNELGGKASLPKCPGVSSEGG